MRSIKTKILSIYVFLILLILLVASVSIYNLYSLNKAVDGLIAANYNSIVAARNMLEALERQDSYELIYIQVENENSIKSFYENQKEFITWLTKARDNITEIEEKTIIDNMSSDYEIYTEFYSKLQQIKGSEGINEASNFYNNGIFPVFLSVKEGSKELLKVNEEAMFNSKNMAAEKSKSQIYITTVISAFSILLGLLVAATYTRKIVSPIHSLISRIKSIKEGNLNQEIEVNTKDEIGELALEFNNMTNRLLLYEKSNVRNLIAERNKSLAIVKSISEPVIVTDQDYKIILVNKSTEEIFHIQEHKVARTHFLEVIYNRDIFNKIKDITDGKEDKDSDSIITIEVENKIRYYVVTTAAIYDNDKNIIGTVTVLQDITELKEIEQMKTDFISTISHELRTPLTSIVMGTELLNDSKIGELNGDQKEIVEAMDEDGKQLLALVEDLLDLSRIESGKIEMNFEDLYLQDIIKQVLKPFFDMAKNKNIKLFYDISEELPTVKIDSSKITCVINNLVSNALKFTETGGEIKVSISREENLIKVAVEDNGAGIPKEYQEAIFDKFVQVEKPGYDGRGTGLGLAISREFIKRHGGSIWVESAASLGSKFIFTLPFQV